MNKLLLATLTLTFGLLLLAGCGSSNEHEVSDNVKTEETKETKETKETTAKLAKTDDGKYVVIKGDLKFELTEEEAKSKFPQYFKEDSNEELESVEVDDSKTTNDDTQYVLDMLEWNSTQYLQTSVDISDYYVDDAHHLTVLSEEEIYAALGDRELSQDQVELISNYVLVQNELAEGLTEKDYAVTSEDGLNYAKDTLDVMVQASWELIELLEGE